MTDPFEKIWYASRARIKLPHIFNREYFKFVLENNSSLNLSKSDFVWKVPLDGWILEGGDRAPARRPRFGLIVLPGRKIGKGEEEMKLGGDGTEVHEW
jgi:hypothetical protein